MKSFVIHVIVLLIGIISVWMIVHIDALEVKYTPNPNNEQDGNGPLPLSMKQRQQLLQLHQTIVSSSDPQATLQQVAQSNNMSNEELYNLLQRNYNDMEQSGAIQDGKVIGNNGTNRRSTMITTILWNAISTLFSILLTIIKSIHPKILSLLVFIIITTIIISTMIIPQNGLCINQCTSRNIITSGPTTIFDPPILYLQEQLVQQPPNTKKSTIFSMRKRNVYDNDDDVEQDELNLSTSIDLWKSIDYEQLFPNSVGYSNNHDDDTDVKNNHESVITTQVWRPKTRKKQGHEPSPIRLVVSSYQTIDIISNIQKKLPKTSSNHKSKVVNSNNSNNRKNPVSNQSKILNPSKITTVTNNDTVDLQIQQQEQDQKEQIMDWWLYHAMKLLYHTPQDMTEFVSLSSSSLFKIKLVVATTASDIEGDEDDDDEETDEEPSLKIKKAILVVPGLGDLKRYALVPLYIHDHNDSEDDNMSLSLTVANGAQFDGQIHVLIQPQYNQDDDSTHDDEDVNQVIVRVSLIVPSKGKEVSEKIAQRITSDLVQSIQQILQIRTLQSMVRTHQSTSYMKYASKRAQQRRDHRTTIERQMEEMAIDRRRKWQHKNPSGISNYRPSGERMRHPNSAVSFR